MDYHDTVRSAEQLAFDLGKALHFSVSDLRNFRRGILPATSCQVLFSKVVRPMVKSAAVTLLPLFGVAFLLSSSHHISISDGLLMIFSRLSNVKELAETEGWFRVVLYGLASLALLGFGVYFATRIPIDLFADIVAKRVKTLDGRVTAREEEKGRAKGGDEVNYYFEMRQCTFPVDRRAFLALDSGGAYRVYYLPRSRTLVAIEPAVLAKEAEEKERKLKDRSIAHEAI